MGVLSLALANRRKFVIGFMSVVLVSFVLVPFLGRNFFPSVDSRPDQHPRPRAHRHASGRNRRAVRPYRDPHPQVVPRRRSPRSSTTSA
jgi:hypothetical protein